MSRSKRVRKRSLSVCHGSCCVLRGARDVEDALKAALRENGLGGKVKVRKGMCSARCESGPVVTVEPDGTVYGGVTPGDAAEIVKGHIVGGKPVKRFALNVKKELVMIR